MPMRLSPKKLHKLHKDYNKLEIKKNVVWLKIDDDYTISINNVIKLVPYFFNKETYVLHYKNLQLQVRPGLTV